MSHKRKRRRKTAKKGGNVKTIEGYSGLWIGVDDSGLDVLLRVREARTSNRDRQIELVGDIVKAEELEKFEGGDKYTLLEAFPRVIKQHMPNKEVYFHIKKRTFGRASGGETIIPVHMRGEVSQSRNQFDGMWWGGS